MLECDQAHEHCWVMTSEMLSLTMGCPFWLKWSSCLVSPGVASSVFLEMMGLAMKQTFAREMNV
jgi:hypothetical protein